MIKLIKEIFSYENLMKALVYGSLSQPHLPTSERVSLLKLIRDMDAKDTNTEIQQKKAA